MLRAGEFDVGGWWKKGGQQSRDSWSTPLSRSGLSFESVFSQPGSFVG